MKVSIDVLRAHLAYSQWANEKLLQASRDLSPGELGRDFGSADKSVVGTLVHVFAAERVWLDRVQSHVPRTFIGEEDREFAALQRAWPPIWEAWKEWADLQTDASIHESVSYHDLKGNAHTTPLWQIVLHLVNHGAHHRGQVTGFLRAMNQKPPALDLIAFYRERAAAE
jgi:uncharacterized damage-inducible protein DinB